MGKQECRFVLCCLALFNFSCLASSVSAKQNMPVELSFSNLYLSEGRDNLAGDNLFSFQSEWRINELAVQPWFAWSGQRDYQEFNLNLVYPLAKLADVSVQLAYAFLVNKEVKHGHYQDHEVSLIFSWADQKALSLQSNWVYSVDTQGLFIDLSSQLALYENANFAWSAGFLVALNADYIADAHNGLNHWQLSNQLQLQLSQALSGGLQLAYSHAIDKDANRYPGDETLANVKYVGLILNYHFN
ncbi:hypothetical protein [Gayadomonas joobiniege]|uniref:hypothetical protein n=1 Tax=Gayadomonas joobiniege TaxID=1234606 RepID=UPI000363A96A|nr:hypothetical protein [Gayadomonas joobiniege]